MLIGRHKESDGKAWEIMAANEFKDINRYVSPENSSYSKRMNAIVSFIYIVLAVFIFLPVLLVIIISFSSEDSINEIGYSFFPKGLSLKAYGYLFNSGGFFGRAFLNSLLITAAGVVFGLMLMCPIAYALSRKEYKLRRGILLFLMIPMLFSGGLVSSYMVNTQIFHLSNSYYALILPNLCSTWFIMILRNYFQNAIPDSLIEAAELDGAGHFQIFRLIVAPVAKPVIMTVALFQTFNYWNSWYPSLLYLDSNHTELYPLQYVLVNMDRSIQTLVRDTQYLSGMNAYTPPTITIRMVMVVVVILPVMLILPFFQQFLKRGMTVGAIKG